MNISEKLAQLRAKREQENSAAKVNNSLPNILVPITSNATTTTEIANAITANDINTALTIPISVSSFNNIQESAALCNDPEENNINHMDFITKMQELQEKIHARHPTMPVLLMQIHNLISSDPELVTLLTEAGIGEIVTGLQAQTKTSLTEVVTKLSTAKAKKIPLNTDMF